MRVATMQTNPARSCANRALMQVLARHLDSNDKKQLWMFLIIQQTCFFHFSDTPQQLMHIHVSLFQQHTAVIDAQTCVFISATHRCICSRHVSSFQQHTTVIDAAPRNTFNILIEATAYSYLIRIQIFEDIQCDPSEIPDSFYPYNQIVDTSDMFLHFSNTPQ